jgi:GGDEF domain-containing protein
VPEPVDPATPRKPPRPRRTKKFVLPDHHHDEQVGDLVAGHIEAFLDGSVIPPRRAPERPERFHRQLTLETRPDWIAALAYESARHARYGRPVTVILLTLTGSADGRVVDRAARALAEAIRSEGRETDRAVRFDAHGFRLLLPETAGGAARTLVQRLERTFLTKLGGSPDGVRLCIEVATAQRGLLEHALTEAETRLAARMRGD